MSAYFFVKNLIFIMNGKIFKQGIGGFEMNMILTILKLIIIPYFLYCLYTVFIFFLTLILSIIVTVSYTHLTLPTT